MKLEPGQLISGTLRLRKRIAEGGMGSVWIAEHLVLGRDVAVKLMSAQWAAMPNARTRFLREARMTANIDSPHVVRVLDCRFDEADEPYLVLELLHGENLEQRVHRHGPLSVYDVEEIVAQTCEGLGATHQAGIVHRDLKPENVFLVAGPTMFVKILDFGVSKPKRIEECLDVDRLPAGTPQYMSPEHMFEPETTDERSDLFSLAAVAYYALTGRSPFEADSLEALYFAIEGANFRRPSELRPELPVALDAWFEKALARERDERFQTAREMADAFRDALRASATMVVAADAASAPDVDDEELPAAELPVVPKMVPGLAKRRWPRVAGVLAAAATAATVLVWRSEGDVRSASASPNDATDPRPAVIVTAPAVEPLATTRKATAAARPKKTSPGTSRVAPPAAPAAPTTTEEPAACDEQVTTSIQEILGTVPNRDVSP